MTIHHDKMAYGKLTSSREDVSEQRLKEMIKKLNEEKEEKPLNEGEKKEDKIPRNNF